MTLATIALALIGAFYVFAGVVALRAGLMAQLLDDAISKLETKPPARVDVLRTRWMLAISALTFLSGLLLIARLDVAFWAFLACAAVQALYLVHVAPNVLDRLDAPDPAGRARTRNALVIFAAATAFVAWAWRTAKLVPLSAATWPVLTLLATLLAAYAAYAIYISRPHGR